MYKAALTKPGQRAKLNEALARLEAS